MVKENKHSPTTQVLGKLGSSENRKHTYKMLSYFQAKINLEWVIELFKEVFCIYVSEGGAKF